MPVKPARGRHGGKRPGSGRKPLRVERLEEARRRKESALADIRCAEAGRLAGTLVVAADMRRAVEADYRAVRSRLLAIPSRLRADRPALSAEDVVAIDRAIRDALTELAAAVT